MDGRWRIKEFAARTGVPEVTLRAWERRYELLAPVRTDGGYRLYSPDDERRLAAMQAHMTRGVAAAEAAKLALAESRPAGDAPSDPALLTAGLLDAVAGYDATEADRMLEGAFALGRGPAIRDVVMPVLREIGERWAANTLTVAHEHFASHLVERRLMRHAADFDTGQGPLALLACPSGERHALGLLSFGVALAEHGWRVAYLGADTPVGQVVEAAARMRPDAVVLAAIESSRLTESAALIRTLRAEHRTLIAGPGATAAVAKKLGVDRLDADPVSAAAAL